MVPPCSDRISRVPPYSRILLGLPLRGYHALWRPFPKASGYVSKITGLVRVRSPLLTESRLMSFPPGTEMFQFPGFASQPYVFRLGSPYGGVSPFGNLRIKGCSPLPTAYRSVPRPSSPLSAKASTKCPYFALINSHTVVKPQDFPHMGKQHSSSLATPHAWTFDEPMPEPLTWVPDLGSSRRAMCPRLEKPLSSRCQNSSLFPREQKSFTRTDAHPPQHLAAEVNVTTTVNMNLFGGARRDRTDDLKLAKLALSQLSYGPRVYAPA